MDKVERYAVEVIKRKHEFYCDNCGEFLGESEEYEDGYYEQKGEYHEEFYICETFFSIKKHVCDKCKRKFEKEIADCLADLGFERRKTR